MSERIYFLHLKTGNKRIACEDAIKNAEYQKSQGVAAHYALFDNTNREKLSNPGWLIWSTRQDGAGVVVPRDDGKLVLLTGWQGDFAYC